MRLTRLWIVYLCGALVAVCGGLGAYLQDNPTPVETPVEFRVGGLPEISREIGRKDFADVPPLKIVRGDDNRLKREVLWACSVPLDLPGKPAGQHLPNPAQQTGDCAAASAVNAISYLQCIAIANGDANEFHRVSVKGLYGTARVTVGKGILGPGPGAILSHVARACTEVGLIFEDDPGVGPYSGHESDLWGARGPPQSLLQLASQRKIGAVVPVEGVEGVRDAICAGYPVQFGDYGWTNNVRTFTRDGRIYADWSGRGGHAMAIIGYDGQVNPPAYYVLNQHGETTYPTPLAGEPPGGYWVTEKKLRNILSGGEAWSYSMTKGFPVRKIRVSLFGQKGSQK